MLKLNIKQIDRGRLHPKEVAKSLNPGGGKRGFHQKTIDVCLSLAKGELNIIDARNRLNLALSEFKDNNGNRKKRTKSFKTLEAFNDFLVYTKMKCLNNFVKVSVEINSERMISGRTCPIFKSIDGRICGVIIVEGEYDYYSSLRAPLERMAIAKRMGISNINDIDIILFHLDGFQHEILSIPNVEPSQLIKTVYHIFESIERELAA